MYLSPCAELLPVPAMQAVSRPAASRILFTSPRLSPPPPPQSPALGEQSPLIEVHSTLDWKTGLLFRKSSITSPPPERDGRETCEVQFLTIPLKNILKRAALLVRKFVAIFFPVGFYFKFERISDWN